MNIYGCLDSAVSVITGAECFELYTSGVRPVVAFLYSNPQFCVEAATDMTGDGVDTT